MKIHANTLTTDDVRAAARLAGVRFDRLEERGSRSRARAFDVILEGSGNQANSGRYGAHEARDAATWDEWGIFLGELFRRDPSATVPNVYDDGGHFTWATGGRYSSELPPADRHKRHRWTAEGSGRAVTGAYHVGVCKCGAVRRFVAYGRRWADISGQSAASA